MLEIAILVLIIVLSFVTGYTVNNKERLKREERCLELARKAKEQDHKIKMRDTVINNQIGKLIMKDEYLKEIIRAAENNTYNKDVCRHKIKELAETAIQN